MSVIKKNRLYAHSSGHTDVCYSADGKHLLTCGSDGDLRIRLGYDDPDPISQVVDSSCFAIACHGDTIYCGSSALFISTFRLPKGERKGKLCRFNAPCTDISISADGKYIASGSCDMSLRVTNIATDEDNSFIGHTGPILGVALDPKGEFLASSSGDGTVKVWNLENQELLKTWYDFAPKCNDFFICPSLARPAWQPTGRLLAIATMKKVIIITRNSWETLIEVDDPKVETWFSVCQFSPCGRMLAACSKNGVLSVWNIDLAELIASDVSPRPIPVSGVAWHPQQKNSDEAEISLCDTEGHLTTMTLKLPSEISDKAASPEAVTSALDEPKVTTTYNSDSDDAASIGVPDSEVASTVGDRPPVVLASRRIELPPEYKLQEPFQPSSTPVTLLRRFMVYNSVGTVQAYSDEAEEKTIDVEFHNTSVYHNFSLPNTHDHTMASLSTAALVLSGEVQSSDAGSKIQCMPLQGNTSNQFWSLDLPEDEEVIGLTASEDFIAVATNQQFLRLLTIGGVQREIYSIPGRFLCMAASQTKLMIVSHASPAMGTDQNLQYMLMKVTMPGVKVEAPRPLPICPNSLLQWCGFTEEGIPCTFDSSGVMRALIDPDIWQVVCSTRALREANILTLNLKSDHVFVVSVCLSSLVMRCILCKGSRYPHTSPPPTVGTVSMKVPMAEMHTDKGTCEGSLVQIRSLCDLLENPSLSSELKDLTGQQIQNLSKAALKLFALTANQDTIKKTIEVYKLLPSRTLRELTRKYSQQAKKHSLLESLSELEESVADAFQAAHEEKWSQVPVRNTCAIDAGPQVIQSYTSPVPVLAPLIPRGNFSRKKSSLSNPASPSGPPTELSLRAPKSTLNSLDNQNNDKNQFLTPDTNPFKRSTSLNRTLSSRSFHAGCEDSNTSVQSIEEVPSPQPLPETQDDSESEVIESSQMEIASTLPLENLENGTHDTPAENESSEHSVQTKNPFLASRGFKEWLTTNKSRICAANPNLDKKEQIKAALKMFNEEKSYHTADKVATNSSENQVPKKRPATEAAAKNPPKIARSTANKLQNFMLMKKKDGQ